MAIWSGSDSDVVVKETLLGGFGCTHLQVSRVGGFVDSDDVDTFNVSVQFVALLAQSRITKRLSVTTCQTFIVIRSIKKISTLLICIVWNMAIYCWGEDPDSRCLFHVRFQVYSQSPESSERDRTKRRNLLPGGNAIPIRQFWGNEPIPPASICSLLHVDQHRTGIWQAVPSDRQVLRNKLVDKGSSDLQSHQ